MAASVPTIPFGGALADARQHMAEGRHAEALASLGRVHQLLPDSPDLFILAATCLRGMERLVEADLCFKAAVSLDPGRGDVYAELGRLRFLVGQAAHAALYMRRCVVRFGATAGAYTDLGMCCKKTGDAETARRCFTAALALDPDHLDARAGLLYCEEADDPRLDLDRLLARFARPDVTFVQIGAMDGMSFDPLYPHVTRWGWNGLLVEPNPESFAKLRRTYAGFPGLIFENVAVTEHPGTATLEFIPNETAHREGLDTSTLGMARIIAAPTDERRPRRPTCVPEFERFAQTMTVDCVSLDTLFAKHDITRVDVLQIDTEGYDWRILKQFDLARYRPAVINVEIIHVSVPERIELLSRLRTHGYLYRIRSIDLLAVRADVFAALTL